MCDCNQWKDIETAPKDGTRILAYDPEGIHGPVYAVVHWYVHKGETYQETESAGLYRRETYEHSWWDGAAYTPFRATHWMSLPAPPVPHDPEVSRASHYS